MSNLMQMKYKKKNQSLMVFVVWFLTITGGVAFAGIQDGANIGVEVPQAVSPQMKKAFDVMTGELSGVMGNAAVNANNLASNASTNTQANISEVDTMHRQTDVINNVGRVYGMTPAAAQQAELEMKTNQAARELYAAADDLANAMTLAIIDKYKNMTHEQAVATWIDEGKRYGFITDNPEVALGDPDHSFSLISKAWAKYGNDDVSYSVPFSAKGQRGEIKGAGPGMTYSGPAQGTPARHVQGAVWTMEGIVVHDTPGRPVCGQSNKSDQCAHDVAAMAYAFGEVGAKIGPTAKKIAFNSIATSSGGGGGSGSGAAERASNVPVVAAISNLEQKQIAFCQAAQQSHDDAGAGCSSSTQSSDNSDHSSFFIASAFAQSGGNKTSALWAKYGRACSLATDQTKHEADLTASAEAAENVKGTIDNHTTACGEVFGSD
jgi:hypothetical protein